MSGLSPHSAPRIQARSSTTTAPGRSWNARENGGFHEGGLPGRGGGRIRSRGSLDARSLSSGLWLARCRSTLTPQPPKEPKPKNSAIQCITQHRSSKPVKAETALLQAPTSSEQSLRGRVQRLRHGSIHARAQPRRQRSRPPLCPPRQPCHCHCHRRASGCQAHRPRRASGCQAHRPRGSGRRDRRHASARPVLAIRSQHASARRLPERRRHHA